MALGLLIIALRGILIQKEYPCQNCVARFVFHVVRMTCECSMSVRTVELSNRLHLLLTHARIGSRVNGQTINYFTMVLYN